MLRKIIAGTAVAGALTFGASGLAGAATSTTSPSGTSTGSSGANHPIVCDKLLPKVESGVQKIENALAPYLSKAEGREARLNNEGNATQAQRLGKGVTWIQNHESKLNARLSKIEAKCGMTGSEGSSGSTGSGS